LHASAAGAERDVGGREDCLRLAVLADLGQGIHKTTDETNENSRYTAECDRRIEEDKTAKRNGELVQSADHGVCGGGGDADSPGGGVGDEDGRETRDDHYDDDGVALLSGEVLLDVG